MSGGLKPTSGITGTTFQHFVLDAGMAVQDYNLPGERILGATRGGGSLTITPEFRKMETDGAPGDIKGDKRIISVEVKLNLTVLEMTDENINLALPGATLVTDAQGTTFSRDCQIAATDYLDNITVLFDKNGTGELFAIKIENAICMNGFDFSFADNDEAALPLELTAHFDPNSLEAEPWEIFNPANVPVVVHTLAYTAGVNGSIIGDTLQSVLDGADGTSVYADADDTYQFVNWTDASTDNPRQDSAVAGDITVTANFALI